MAPPLPAAVAEEDERRFARRVQRVSRMVTLLLDSSSASRPSAAEAGPDSQPAGLCDSLMALRSRLLGIRAEIRVGVNGSARRRLEEAVRTVQADIDSGMYFSERELRTRQQSARRRSRRLSSRETPAPSRTVARTESDTVSAAATAAAAAGAAVGDGEVSAVGVGGGRVSRATDESVVVTPLSSPAAERRLSRPTSAPSPLRHATAEPHSPARSSSARSLRCRVSMGDGMQCPVCLESLVVLRRAHGDFLVTKCGHWFCRRCLQSSLTLSKTCPVCRTKLLRPSAYHILYL